MAPCGFSPWPLNRGDALPPVRLPPPRLPPAPGPGHTGPVTIGSNPISSSPEGEQASLPQEDGADRLGGKLNAIPYPSFREVSTPPERGHRKYNFWNAYVGDIVRGHQTFVIQIEHPEKEQDATALVGE